MKPTVHGVGINDAGYKVSKSLKSAKRGTKEWLCPFYSTWCSMLNRCYSKKYQENKPTYAGCSVCDEWLTFSNFKRWMETQDYKGMHLDKDILNPGNKTYSPENCLFLTPLANTFFSDAKAIRGKFMIGVVFDKERSKFAAYCGNPFTKRREFLGRFDDEMSAYSAWLKTKRRHALELAKDQPSELAAVAVASFCHRTTAELVNVIAE